jgi:hypothetical protein
MNQVDREVLGRVVREAWVQWAKEQPDVVNRPEWTDPWEKIPERIREVDCRIGEAVLDRVLLGLNSRRIDLIEKSLDRLSPAEAAEYEVLQPGFFEVLAIKYPRQPRQPLRGNLP